MTSQWSCYNCYDSSGLMFELQRHKTHAPQHHQGPVGQSLGDLSATSPQFAVVDVHDSSHLQNTHCIGPKKKQFHTSTMILGGWKQLQWDELGFITCSKPWYLLVPWPGTPVTTCILISANIENHTKWWPLAIMKLVLITPSNSSYMML